VDGGITIQRFLQAGLIQRLIITRVPVLIGTGIPLFGPLRHDIALKHIATRQYASGLVQSEYKVQGKRKTSGTTRRARVSLTRSTRKPPNTLQRTRQKAARR
jgi:dihydrofolate reductase